MGRCGDEPAGGRVGTDMARAGIVSASAWETMPPRSCNWTGKSVWAKREQECNTPGRGKGRQGHSEE
eukprot:2456434-Prorocentrum_lima.AAC.1